MNIPLDCAVPETETSGPPMVSSLELRAALAEARTVAGFAVVRAMSWCAWTENNNADYDVVHENVLRAVRELGLPLSEAQASREVLGVADVHEASNSMCAPSR